MFETFNNIIRITKGDTATLEVALKYTDGTPYTMKATDKLTLTVRKKPGHPEVIFAIVTTGNNIIELPHSETTKLPVGTCCYDVQLDTADGGVFTVVGLTDRINVNMIVYPEITE